METEKGRHIQAVLFVCGFNVIRSPMAEAIARHFFGRTLYIQSAGVTKGTLDPFTIAVLEEIGIDAGKHKPRTIEELDDWEGLNFDLIISLSPPPRSRSTSSMPVPLEWRAGAGMLSRCGVQTAAPFSVAGCADCRLRPP